MKNLLLDMSGCNFTINDVINSWKERIINHSKHGLYGQIISRNEKWELFFFTAVPNDLITHKITNITLDGTVDIEFNEYGVELIDGLKTNIKFELYCVPRGMYYDGTFTLFAIDLVAKN